MILLDYFPPADGWQVELLATDLSTKILAQARAAVWPIEKAVEIPDHYLKRFMLKSKDPQSGLMKAGPALRAAVRFRRLNLNDPDYPGVGQFDLIFCRNVLIYFDVQSKTGVINRLLNHLLPGGHFFLGQSETLDTSTINLQCLKPSIYAAPAR
jgi:chemotaxis protein methyltransferase CheR